MIFLTDSEFGFLDWPIVLGLRDELGIEFRLTAQTTWLAQSGEDGLGAAPDSARAAFKLPLKEEDDWTTLMGFAKQLGVALFAATVGESGCEGRAGLEHDGDGDGAWEG